MTKNSKDIGFLKSQPNFTFKQYFSTDTWQDSCGRIHHNKDLAFLPYKEWKYLLLTGPTKNSYNVPDEFSKTTFGIWELSHPDIHYEKKYLKGTLEQAIRYLINDEKYNKGWGEYDMGKIRKIEIFEL